MAASVFISGATETAVVDSLDGLRALECEWRELWRTDGSATPFHSPDWLIPWTRYLWGGGKLQVVTQRQAGRLAAAAPFFIWGYGRSELRLSLLGCGISNYLGMISAPDFADEAAAVVARWMTQPDVEWSSCDLQELRPGDPPSAVDLGVGAERGRDHHARWYRRRRRDLRARAARHAPAAWLW